MSKLACLDIPPDVLLAMQTAFGPQYIQTLKHRLSWSIEVVVTPAGPGDIFFYLRNTSQVQDLVITRIYYDSDGAETITVGQVTGTPAGGTDIVPTNRTVGSSNAFEGVVQQGTGITGLTNVGNIERLRVPGPGEAFVEAADDLLHRPIYMPAAQIQTNGIAMAQVGGGSVVNMVIDVMVPLPVA